MPSYKVNDQVFTIPDDKIDLFEADFPEAQLQYKVNDGTSFTIPANKRVDFLADFPDAQEVGWDPLQAPEPQTVASNETIVEKQTVPQEEKLRGFRAGARESWKGLKAGTRFAFGELANMVTGSSDQDANALYKLDEMLREGKDVSKEVEGAWSDAGRELRTGALEFLPGWMIKGWKEKIHTEADKQRVLDDIRDVLGEAGGDVAKARQLLAERAEEKTFGDIQKTKAAEEFAQVQPTEGFGAWLGSNTIQMIPSASALIVGALSKSPAAARAIGMIGMGGMTAATAGSSMYEAREAGASDLETRKVGVIDGAIEYITEKLPFDNYTNWMVGKAKSKVSADIAKALRSNSPIKNELEDLLVAANKELGGKLFSKKNLTQYIADMAAEGLSEFSAEASQTMTKLIYEDEEKWPLLKEAVGNGMQGMLAGLFMGAVLGGASMTMEHNQNKDRRKSQGYVDVGVVNFGTAENPENEVVEVLSVDDDTQRAQVLRNGAIENVNKDAIGQSYRFSYNAFEAARMRVLESEALDNKTVTEGQVKAASDRVTAAGNTLVDALKASGKSDEEIANIMDEANSDKKTIHMDEDVAAAYDAYLDARERERAVFKTFNAQKQLDKTLKREEIQKAAGQDFWREIPTEKEGVTTWELIVTHAQLQDGRTVYLFPGIDATETAGVTVDGEKVFVTPDMIVEGSEVTEDLDTYLDNLVAGDKAAKEQARMGEQTQDRLAEARAAAQPGTDVNIGTVEEPINAKVINQSPDGVVVESETGVSQLSWDEYANAMNIGSPVLTDEETASFEAAEILGAESAYQAEQVTVPSDIEDAAEQTTAAVEEEKAAEPLPTKKDGSVDQTTLWNQNPRRWAEWNDEQRQDGGANSLAYITNALAKEQKKLNELNKAYNAESDFDVRATIEENIVATNGRIAQLTELQQKYAPAEEVAEAESAPEVAEQQEVVEEPAAEEVDTMVQRVRNTLAELYADDSLSDQEIDEYIAANVAGSQSDLDKHIAKAPKMGRDMEKYKQDREKHEAKTKELEAERDFWKEVQSYTSVQTSEMDMEPQNALEFTAKELSSKSGIKLQRDSFKKHTGYGAEAFNFLSMFRGKDKGGLTLEEAGERLMELDRENNTGFFDQSDPNAGLNAILDVLQGAKTSGDVYRYIRNAREELARQEAQAARNALMEDVAQPEPMQQNEVVEQAEIIEQAEDVGDIPDEIWEGFVEETTSLDEDMPDFENMSEEETAFRAANIIAPETEQIAAVKDRVFKWEKRLGIKIKLLTNAEQVTNKKAREAIESGAAVSGWFEDKTGEVVVYAPNVQDLSEVDKTVIHEVVSHKGLRGLLGKKGFNALCNSVWKTMTPEARAKYLQYENVLSKKRMAEYLANPEAFVPTEAEQRAAADEFIARYSESVNVDKNAWQKMIDSVKRFIHKLTGKYTLGDQLGELIEASLARYEQIAKMELKGVVEEGATYRGVIDAETGAMINPSANEQAEGNTALRAKDGMLVGMHNISEDKLRKAIKQGGLANPSTAVVNIAEYSLEGYGDISLIMPSSLVDSETGDNAGTYTGDAWTPTYPTISRQIDDAGWKIVKDRIRAAVGESDDLYHDIVNSVDNYLSDDRNSRLEFVFLKEKGIEPKIELKGADGYVGLRNLEAILGVEGLRDSMESYEKYKAASPMAKRSFNMWQRVGGDKKAHKALKDEIRQYPQFAKLMGLDEDLTFAGFDSFTYSIFRKEYDAGNVNTIDTLGGASRYVDANDMRTEFDAWLESLMEEAGAKEVFFAGWTRDGDRIYKDNTLENVSRHMRMQGRTNAYNDHGLSATKSALLQRLTSLAEIRKNRARLQDESSYNRAYDKLKDRLFSVISQLADMEKISDNPFMNIDYAEARLQEAIVKKNPISYLNNEYGYSIDPKGEYAEELKSFIKDVQKMPAKYFETKFERPVYLNEFAAAVMPNNTSEDVKQAITEAGLPIFEYDSSVEGARREATLKATEEEGVRFRILGEMGAANLDAAEEATIRLDNLDVARQMEEAGKDAKTIKLATGWERGVDNLWRYEVPDEYNLADLEKRLQEELDNGAVKTWGIVYPSDLGQLLKEYPDFNVDIMVWVGDEFENTGAYSPATEGDENTFGRSATIEVEAKTIADVAPLLAHEIQHAIQEMEGFAEGGQARGLNDKLSAELDKRVATIKQLREEGRNEEADELMQMSKGLAEAVINNDDDAYGNYKKLAGEVEARNAAKRIGKSLQERRESLLSETEDVAREDQIILIDGLNARAQFIPSLLNLRKAVNKIKSWMSNNTRNDSFEIALPNSVLRKIRSVMGRDFDSHNITANGLAHALKNHGVNGKKLSDTSIPIRKEDMELVPYIMTAPDRIEKGSTKNNRESVRFIKNISNGYIVVIEKELDNSMDDLETINMWAELSDVSNATRTLNSTSETSTIGRSDIAKIRKDAEDAILSEELKQKISQVSTAHNSLLNATSSALSADKGSNNLGEGDTRFRITPEQDKAYMDAVEAGDMETVAKMVAEAVKLAMPNTTVVDENGYPREVYRVDEYRGNRNKYTNVYGGVFYADTEEYFDHSDTGHKKENAEPFYINTEGFFDPMNEMTGLMVNSWADILGKKSEFEKYDIEDESDTDRGFYNNGEEVMTTSTDGLALAAQRMGYKGVILRDIPQRNGNDFTEYAVFNSNAIKSAKLVTHDDNGNVIPLSQRFHPENEDIRFRVTDEAIELYEEMLNEYRSKYNEVAPTSVVDIRSRKSLADALGVSVEELGWLRYFTTRLAVLRGLRGGYAADFDRIAIFADNSNMDRGSIESKIFHESIHKVTKDNPQLLELGKWMWDNLDTITANYAREAIKKDYDKAEYADEMVSCVVGTYMSIGKTQHFLSYLPEEHKANVELIFNTIGYESEREDRERDLRRQQRDDRGLVQEQSAGRQMEKESVENQQDTGTSFRIGITPEVRDEMDAIKASAIVMGNFMKAPNGKDTNLTEEQWAMVRTKNFIDWFGDWLNDPENASKVVDENGEPKVVYHGTPWDIYSEPEGEASFRSGWFTGLKHRAEGFGKPIEAFLSIKVPAYAYDGAHKVNDTELPESFDLNDTRTFGEFDGYISYIDYPEIPSLSKIAEMRIKMLHPDNYEEVIAEQLANEPRGRQIFSVIPKISSQIKSATDNTGEFSVEDTDIRYRVVTDSAKIEVLENGPKIKVYRAMQLIDGKLYPPMSAKVDGQLREPIELGQWEEAEERPDLADNKGYFKLNKGNKKSLKARYNPYFHTSYTPLNDQFSEAQDRPNLVTVEVEIPVSELTAGYKAEKAKDSVGEKEWKAGVIQGKLSGTRKVILSRWDKPVRIVPDSEVADVIVKMLEGRDIVMPSNVVTPSLRAELEKRGVPFVETDNKGKPISEFGPIYEQFRGKPKEAVEFLMEKKTGEAVGALNHKDIGDISIVYGNEKAGLKKIAVKHPEVLDILQDILDDATIVQQSENRIKLESGRYFAVISKDYLGKPRAPWLLTSFEKKNSVPDNTMDTGETSKGSKQNDTATLQDTVSESKDSDNIDTSNELDENTSFRVTGTPTEDVVAEGVSLSPAQLASLAGDIFSALPEDSRKKITDSLNGNILGLQDAILQIPTSLATKENWNDEDRQMAEVVAEQMTKAVDIEMTRPFSASEALWLLYNAVNKSTDLVSEASRALVKRNLGFGPETLEKLERAKDDVRFRTVGDASDNARASLYNKEATNVWSRLKEAFVDMNASVEGLVKAIEQLSGKVAKGFENILLALNQQSSKGLKAMKAYESQFLQPMLDEVKRIMEVTGRTYDDVVRYVILKHGLERNEAFAKRDAREYYRAEFDKKVAAIESNASLSDVEKMSKKAEAQREFDAHMADIDASIDAKYREFKEKDYSGLTSMFYDQLGVNRKDYQTEEEYQAALMDAKRDKYDTIADVENAAEAEVLDFERMVNTDSLWAKINASTKEILKQQYEANMISKDQYETLKDMFEYYVPLRGFKDNTAEDMYTYYRKPNSTGYTKPILAAEGRKTEAESPFGWIAAMASSAIASNVKNEAKLALYYFVSNRPDNGIATISKTWFMDSGELDADGKKIFKPVYPSFTEGLSTDAAKAAYEAWQENMRQLRDKGQAYESGQKLSLGNAVVNISDAHKPEHVVTVKVGGKDYTIVINGNPRAAQAINGDLNIETVGDYSNFFGPALRWMSSVNTSYNPEFWFTNLQRDMLFTLMNVSTKDPAFREAFRKNYMKAFKVISMIRKDEKGTLGSSYLENLYKEFTKYGGVTGYTQIKDNEVWEKEIAKYMDSKDAEQRKIGRVLSYMKRGFHAMHRFGEGLEQVSRFAAFIAARETGMDMNAAINESKEITVNFNRKGSGKKISFEEAKYLTNKKGQPLNKFEQAAVVGLSSIAPLGRRFIMFFNASIQGLNSMAKLYRRNPSKMNAWLLGYAALGVMQALLHSMMDDEDEYLDIPEYERRNSLLLGGNGVYFKWALPQEARVAYAFGDLAVESILGRNVHESIIGEALKVGSEVLPINPTEGARAFLPSVAIPFVEIIVNEDYKGDPIYNEQKWLSEEEKKHTPKWESAYKGTGVVYVSLAKLLNNVTDGKDADQAGLANYQPEVIEHIVQSAFGGALRTMDKFFNMVTSVVDPEEEVTIRQTPFLNRFLTINDERFRNAYANDVYEYYEGEAKNVASLIKKYQKAKDAESLRELMSKDEYQWARIYNKYKKPIKNIQEKIKVAEGTSEKMELMKQQDELKKRMIKEISEL